LTEAFSPGACVAVVARRNDVSTSLIYQWRDKLRGATSAPAFVEAVIGDGASQDEGDVRPAVLVECSCGIKVMISASASPSLATAHVERVAVTGSNANNIPNFKTWAAANLPGY
jgi:transposase